MIEPKEITLKDQNGVERTFLIHKFPAIAGREIVTKYPTSNVPKIGDYAVSEETMLKAMAFVSVVPREGSPIPLTTRALVDNHAGDWETLAKLEWAILEYNTSFFGKGLNSDFFESISQKAVTLITRMLTDLSAASSRTGKPPSTS